MAEEVLEKYKVAEAKKGAYKKVKRQQQNGVKIGGREFGLSAGLTACNEARACRRQTTQKKWRQHAEWTQTAVGGSVSCWPLIATKRGSTQKKRTRCSSGTAGCMR